MQAERILQRIYHRLRAAAADLLESADGVWAAVTLPYTAELAARPDRLATLQDAQLGALFAAALHSQRLGGDSRIDLLAPYPASLEEFAAQREFIEGVAEQTLGHAYAAACRIGALLAPDVGPAAAGENRAYRRFPGAGRRGGGGRARGRTPPRASRRRRLGCWPPCAGCGRQRQCSPRGHRRRTRWPICMRSA